MGDKEASLSVLQYGDGTCKLCCDFVMMFLEAA
jgi:hypothetical protein